MPVVAVVAAVALDASLIGTAVTVGIGAIGVLSAVTAIGATLGAIGAVTHNKTLSMVGAGLGLVGGVGSLAFGSGALGTVGDLFGETADAAGGAGSVGAAAAGEAGTTGSGAVTVTDLPPAATDITTATGAINQNAFNPAGAINSTSIAPATGDAAAIVTGGQAGSPLAESLSPAVTSGGATGAATTPDFMSHFGQVMNTLPDGTELTDVATKAGGGIMNWAKNNAMLSYGIVQAGGSFISGLTNPMTPAQIDALNAQSDVNRATASLLKRETANQGQGLPSATVTGHVAPAGGLINNRPVGTPLITGAPNMGAPATSATGTI